MLTDVEKEATSGPLRINPKSISSIFPLNGRDLTEKHVVWKIPAQSLRKIKESVFSVEIVTKPKFTEH